MQIQISWLLQKPTDLDLHCLLRQDMSCSAREGLKCFLPPSVKQSTLQGKNLIRFWYRASRMEDLPACSNGSSRLTFDLLSAWLNLLPYIYGKLLDADSPTPPLSPPPPPPPTPMFSALAPGLPFSIQRAKANKTEAFWLCSLTV